MRTWKRSAEWRACMAALLAVLLTVFSAASAAHTHQPQQHAPADACAVCISIAQFQATCVVVALLLLTSTWEQMDPRPVANAMRARWMPRRCRIRPPPAFRPS